jgi:hypothetical protein
MLTPVPPTPEEVGAAYAAWKHREWLERSRRDQQPWHGWWIGLGLCAATMVGGAVLLWCLRW